MDKWHIFKYSKYYMFLYDTLFYTEREKAYREVMKYVAVSKVEGDYYEFGVFHGNTMITAWHFAKRHKLDDMKFWGFDSFEGLPEIKSKDAEGFKHFEQGQFGCTIEQTNKIMKSKGVNTEEIRLIPGWFHESLPLHKNVIKFRKAAVVMIDCDLYESTVPVLEFLTDLVQEGTIILFDDWNCFRGNPERGEQKAFSEWLAKNPDIKAVPFMKFHWNGMVFLMRR